MEQIQEAEDSRVHASIILFFAVVAGFLVFFGGSSVASLVGNSHLNINQRVAGLGTHLVILVGLLVLALRLRKDSRLKIYWRLAFAYFIAAMAIFLSDFAGDLALSMTGQSLSTAKGFTALKLAEDAAIIGTIIVFVLLTRDDPRESYLTWGRFRLGLAIGIPSFLVFTILGLKITLDQGVPSDKIRELLPVFLLIILADGFMEEMLFRGLFLKRLGRFVGEHWAIIVTSFVFTLLHLDVTFTSSMTIFIIILFLLGMLWGLLMQRTGSLLASALFHAGVDMLIISDAFHAYGIIK